MLFLMHNLPEGPPSAGATDGRKLGVAGGRAVTSFGGSVSFSCGWSPWLASSAVGSADSAGAASSASPFPEAACFSWGAAASSWGAGISLSGAVLASSTVFSVRAGNASYKRSSGLQSCCVMSTNYYTFLSPKCSCLYKPAPFETRYNWHWSIRICFASIQCYN